MYSMIHIKSAVQQAKKVKLPQRQIHSFYVINPTLWRRPSYSSVYDPRTTGLSCLLPQQLQLKTPLSLISEQKKKKRENCPINLSESKPRCFPLNNESGTSGPSQERNSLLKNCSLVESSFSFLIPNPFKSAKWESRESCATLVDIV